MAQPVKAKIKSSSSSRTSQARRAGCMQIGLKILGTSFLCLIAFCVIRAFILYPYPKLPEPCDQQSGHQAITIETGIVDRFRAALTYKTISWSVGNYDRDELVRFREFIQKSFPTLHSSPLVKREIIANYSLLYEIEGADKSLKPYMLCAHMDVVPVERDKWNFDPFGGNVDGGFIYGRGAVDVKDALMGILEAIEFELRRGFKPKRTIYLAFGHDEEVMGKDGAVAIRDYLMAKGVQLEFLLDEGTVILKEAIVGVPVEKVAVIGVAEKGYLTVKLEVQGEAGHASVVPYESTIVILSKALSKFNSHAHLDMFGSGPERSFFESLAFYANPAMKVILGNLWLFGWLYSRIVSLYPVGNAMVRTTSVVTVINGGLKDNMIPTFASALINHRIHPSQTINDIVEYDKKIINDDRVNVSIVYGNEPASSSPHGDDIFGYQTLKQSIQQIFPDTVVVPGIMIAGTDTKWYKPLTECIFRFSPLVIFKEEMILFHGHNERISIDNYVKAVNFYHHVILAADRSELPKPVVKDEL